MHWVTWLAGRWQALGVGNGLQSIIPTLLTSGVMARRR